VVPPIESEPVPVNPALGLHDIASEFTVMPGTGVTVPSDMVNEPVVPLELLVMVPAAVASVEKRVTLPAALKLQLPVSV